jgi:Zn-dependent membrane protease YugP
MDILLFILSILVTVFSQIYLSVVFKKFSKLENSKQLSGDEVANILLKKEGVSTVGVSKSPAKLSDHYDPINKSVGLSNDIFNSRSMLSLAVAAHEVGHAVQDHKNYKFLKLRSSIFPVVSVSSNIAPWVIVASFIFQSTNAFLLGIFCFAFTVLFSLITLPVEIDASKRALLLIKQHKLCTSSELKIVKKILTAAALTYVAAAAVSLLELLRYIIIYRSND